MAVVSVVAALVLGAGGVGNAHFGEAQHAAVAALRAQLGAPTARFVNSGCGARYTEVEWGRLYAEFRSHRFSGFRYLAHRWLTASPAAPFPKLRTGRGISLGSSFAQLRAVYGPLRLVGADRWRSSDGLVFYDDGHGRVAEIKTGTCGDF